MTVTSFDIPLSFRGKTPYCFHFFKIQKKVRNQIITFFNDNYQQRWFLKNSKLAWSAWNSWYLLYTSTPHCVRIISAANSNCVYSFCSLTPHSFSKAQTEKRIKRKQGYAKHIVLRLATFPGFFSIPSSYVRMSTCK